MTDLPFPQLREKLGAPLVTSDWIDVTQDRINRFADATGDHQWIHVDETRARTESPFGAPIAHGFLTLSLLPSLMGDFFERFEVRQALNYGCERVRFAAPVPVDARIRAHFTLKDTQEGPMGSLKCVVSAAVEIEGAEKPACIADQIFLLFP